METKSDKTAPLERWQRAVFRTADRFGELMREGGMLIVVFGLLDYFVAPDKLGPSWRWYSASIGAIIIAAGVVLDLRVHE